MFHSYIMINRESINASIQPHKKSLPNLVLPFCLLAIISMLWFQRSTVLSLVPPSLNLWLLTWLRWPHGHLNLKHSPLYIQSLLLLVSLSLISTYRTTLQMTPLKTPNLTHHPALISFLSRPLKIRSLTARHLPMILKRKGRAKPSDFVNLMERRIMWFLP